jgi:anti-sigma regulatory factor (Ser/Thr protein kinase)
LNLSRHEWRSDIPATLDAIEAFCAEFNLWRTVTCVGLASFPAELLLREALTNSVVHGCGEDPLRHVSCVLRARRGRLLIAIQDTGRGFDWHAVSPPGPDLETHGRGLEIFRRYANAVHFNQKGNSVTLIKRF